MNNVLLSHVKVYEAADFYDIPTLKLVVAREFGIELQKFDQHVFLAAIDAVYNSNIPPTDRTLHDLVLTAITANTSKLLKPGGSTEDVHSQFMDLMDRVLELGKDLTLRISAYVIEPRPELVGKCQCGSVWGMPL